MPTPTPVYLTGFEHGVASLNGSGLFISTLTNATIVSTPVRNGGRALRINAGSGAIGQADLFAANNATVVTRFAVRLAALPTQNRGLFTFQSTGINCIIGFVASTGRFGLLKDTVTPPAVVDGSWGPVVAVDTWYVFDVKLARGTTTISGKVKADGDAAFTDLADVTDASWNATTVNVRCGSEYSATSAVDAYFDDVLISTTAADWPVGDGKIIAILPGSDGAHSFTANDFLFGDAGTQKAPTDTDLWTMVEDAPPWTTTRSTTDSLGQRVIRTTGYAEIAPAATPETGIANGVRALLAYSASTTTADNGGCIIRNSAGSSAVIFGDLPVAQGGGGGALADYSETSNFFKGAIAPIPGAGWTPSEVNALRWRLGGSGDISPIPTWQALLLEADYPVSAVVAARPPRSRSGASRAARRGGAVFA